MDWLGNRFSGVKDQFTSLTKELLAEADDDTQQPRFVPFEKFNRLIKICEEKEEQLCQQQLEIDKLRKALKGHLFLPANTNDSSFQNVDLSANSQTECSTRKEFFESDELQNSNTSAEAEVDVGALQCDEDNADEKQAQNVLRRIENIGGKNRLEHLLAILKEVKLLYDAEKSKLKPSSSDISFPSSKNSHGTDETMSNDSERSDDSLLHDFEVLKPRSTSGKSLEEFNIRNVEVQTSRSEKCSTSTQSEFEFDSDRRSVQTSNEDGSHLKEPNKIKRGQRRIEDDELSPKNLVTQFRDVVCSLDSNLRCWEEIFHKMNANFNNDSKTMVGSDETFWTEMNETVFKNNDVLKNCVFALAEENKLWKQFYESLNPDDQYSKKQIEKFFKKKPSLTQTMEQKNSSGWEHDDDDDDDDDDDNDNDQLHTYSQKLENFNQSLNKVSDEIVDQSSELNSLYELKQLNEAKSQLKKENAELSAMIARLQKGERADESKRETMELREKYSALETEHQVLRDKMHSLRQQLHESEIVNDSLDIDLQETRNSFISREQKLKAEIESLRTEMTTMKDDMNDTRTNELVLEVNSLQAKLLDAKNECRALRESLKEARLSFTSLECQCRNEIESLWENVLALERTTNNFDGKILYVEMKDDQSWELEPLSQVLVDGDRERPTNKLDSVELDQIKRIKINERKLCALKAKLDDLKTELPALLDEIEKTKHFCTVLRNMEPIEKTNLEPHSDESMYKLRNEAIALHKELDKATLANESLNEELQLLRNSFADREARLIEEIESLQNRISIQEQQDNTLQLLQHQLDEITTTNESLIKQLQGIKTSSLAHERELHQEINDLRQKAESLQNALHSTSDRLKESEKCNASLVCELQAARSAENEVTRKTAVLEERIRVLIDETTLKRDEYEQKVEFLRKQLQESNEKREALDSALRESNDARTSSQLSLREDIEKLKTKEMELLSICEQLRTDIVSKDETIASLLLRNETLAKEAESVKLKLVDEANSLLTAQRNSILEEENKQLNGKIENLLSTEGIEETDGPLRDLYSILKTYFDTSDKSEIWTKLAEYVNRTHSNSNVEGITAERSEKLQEFEMEKVSLMEKMAMLEKDFKRQIEQCDEQKKNILELESKLNCMTSEREQLITSLKDKHNESLSYHTELQKVHALFVAEVEKNKEYSQQMHELKQKLANHNNIITELERLRAHLLSMEESYTNDLLNSEQQITELNHKLSEYEDRIKSINATQTSVNVRTNQITESLQKEIKVLTEEKEKLALTLRTCQTELQHSTYDAQNLRSALDLFHRNKDSEIFQATEKLRMDIQLLQNENRVLEETVGVLQRNIDTMKETCSKTSEVYEEIRRKEEIIKSLEMQVKNTQNELNRAEAKIIELKDDTENKFKQDLLKNIIMRYIAGNTESMKTQALQILAEVLNFTAEERHRFGLSSGAPSTSQRDESGSSKNQSLIDEFIRFVEKESDPKGSSTAQKKNNPNILLSSTPSLPDIMLPTLSQFPTSHNSSYILKDALQ